MSKGACVAQNPRNAPIAWRVSSYSGNGGGQCVEMAPGGLVRDSKNPGQGHLAPGVAAVAALIAAVKAGKYDL